MDLKELRIASEAGSARHPWELARIAILRDWLRRFPPQPGAVVDVGCGDAFCLASISLFVAGPCIGVDSAWENGALGPMGTSVVNSLDQVALDAPAGAVLLMDVLEHLAEPAGLLTDLQARGIVGDRTLVFVTVPAFQSVFSDHDEFLGHYRRYSRQGLLDLIDESGLVPVASGYLFSSLLAVRWLQCRWQGLVRRAPSFSGVAQWQGPAWLTEAVTRLLLWDAAFAGLVERLSGLRLPGLSCYAVCRAKSS